MNRIGLSKTYCTMENGSKQRWLCADLPVMEYTEAWNLQSVLVSARKEGVIDRNVILLLEHPSVLTLGRRGGLDDLTVSKNFLKKAGISIIHVERGGHITYHGPGQLVVYPIIDLRQARLKVGDYVDSLEEVMIRTAADWGIRAERNAMNRGVWVDSKKLGSIGIAIRRGICFHGMAFNVNVSLTPFGWINPCGLRHVGMTSVERELEYEVSLSQVRKTVKRHIKAVFGVGLISTDLSELKSMAINYDHSKSEIDNIHQEALLA